METPIEKELSLHELLQVYRRRKSIVYGVTLTLFVLCVIYCVVCTRRYEASGEVQVQKEGVDAMGLENLMGSVGGDQSSPLSANIELETQSNILQSDTLALRTIDLLHMEGSYDFRHRWNPLDWILDIFSPHVPADRPGATLEDSPRRRERALKIFSKHLKVKPQSGTRLIDISYTDPDPKLAAAVVNTLTRALSDYTFQTRYDATNQASRWLSDQLGDLRKDSEDLQAKVVDLQRESGVYSLGVVNAQGQEQAYSEVLDRLQQSTAALNAAEQNRILKGAIAKAAETGDAEMLSSLAGNNLMSTSPTVNNTLTLIQNLRQQEAAQQAVLREAQAKFGPAYPKLAELRGNIEGIDNAIKQEVTRIKGRAESDYEIAKQNEELTRKNYDESKKKADVLNNKAIEYQIIRQEAEDSRVLYEDLLKRLKEAGVLEGLRSSNITVVDPGREPAKPKTPNVPLYMALAVFGGWIFGCCGAFLIDTLDNKVNTAYDVEDMFKESPLGVLPQLEQVGRRTVQGHPLLAVEDPRGAYIEAIRSIRTALLLSQSDAPPKVLLVTSSIAGEGKSLCSVNMAAVTAQAGKRTLIIDTDLRRGALRARLRLPHGPGLSELLAGHLTTPPVQAVAGAENLNALIAGAAPPNPIALLESTAMRTWLDYFRSKYDFVLLDSAPVLPVSDSLILNTLVDTTLLLVRSRTTERPQALRSYELLKRNGNHYVGIVLNALNVSDSSYYGYHGYGKYEHPYGEESGHETK